LTKVAPPLLTNRHQDHLTTRRSILIGAAAALICAPAIVRVTSLMPVRSLRGPMNTGLCCASGPHYAGFCERFMYRSLESDLRTGRMNTVCNGEIIPEADARRLVAYARAHGWLPPEA
jgi:hypothetical protein